MDHIGSYFLGIDFTNRALQDDFKRDGADWSLCKGADSFAAVSDFIDKNEIEDCHDLELELRVNGKIRQAESTKLMIFGVPRLIADISKYIVLNEGDMIYTGTPAGVGPVAKGDEIYGHLRKPGSESNLLELNVKVEQ